MLLTTRDRKTGEPRTVPVFYLRDGHNLVATYENFESAGGGQLAGQSARGSARHDSDRVHGRQLSRPPGYRRGD
jgi:hypothetical protein